ncbi:MAG: DUF924 domain-containing protein [Bdellovibrionales bacterium]|nr:DUF924 domain-containing protein [Bdellovibrionales bacterium]
MDATEVIEFWFQEIDSKFWWVKDSNFDETLRQRFLDTHKKARQGELNSWRVSALGRLAEIIVLDQFSRNMFRDAPQAFAYDGMALVLAQESISLKVEDQLTNQQKSFLFMPFMHSESKAIHEKAVELFSQSGLEGNLDFELQHKKIIDRFGRYPHRNKILGRKSTPEELAFLKEPGSSF